MPREKAEVVLAREYEVWKLRTRAFMSQSEIAEAMGLNQATVSKILKRVRTKYTTELTEEVEQMKVEQTAMLEGIISELYEAWEKSKQARVTKTQQERDGDSGKETTKGQKNEQQIGDPRYIAEIRGAMQDIRKIWGADAPTKTETTTPEQAGTMFNAQERMSRLSALIKIVPPAQLPPPVEVINVTPSVQEAEPEA